MTITTSTQTYWDVDGVPLQSYAWNIETLGGGRLAPPPMRGDDITVPYAPGQVWTPKQPDARVISLGMWVLGSNDDGTIPEDEDMRRVFDRNWRMLRKLLWRPRKQFTLGKRFWVPTDDLTEANATSLALATSGDWSLIYAAAKASYDDGLEPEMSGPTRASFTVDLRLSHPYFYAGQLTVEFSATSGEALPGPTQTVTVLGDDRTSDINMHFEGPLTTPKFTASQDGEDIDQWVQYTNIIADGDTADIAVRDFYAEQTVSSATSVASGYLSHYGGQELWWLEPGENDIELTVADGTGTATLQYRPAFL